MNSATLPAPMVFKKALGWSMALSVLLILSGILAIVVPLTGALAVTLVVAWLLIFSGAVHLVFAWHLRHAGGIVWEILVGLAYAFIGGYMLAHPLLGIESLTLALAIYLFAEAILEFVLAARLQNRPGRGWLVFDGVITLILAVMIWRVWPSNTAWILGTLVGISMLFSGTSRLMMSFEARKLIAPTA